MVRQREWTDLVSRWRVAARRVEPVVVPVASLGGGLVVGRLVPFVLAGNPEPGPRVAHNVQTATGRSVQRVGPLFRRPGILRPRWTAVVQPVAEAGRVEPAHEGHGTGPGPDHGVGEIPRRSVLGDSGDVLVCRQGRAVERMGVRRRHRVEEGGVLRQGDLGFADLEFVVHAAERALPEILVRGIAHIAHLHHLDEGRGRRGGGSQLLLQGCDLFFQLLDDPRRGAGRGGFDARDQSGQGADDSKGRHEREASGAFDQQGTCHGDRVAESSKTRQSGNLPLG